MWGAGRLKVDTVKQCGVMYDRRNLNIGYFWIARERVGEVGGSAGRSIPGS